MQAGNVVAQAVFVIPSEEIVEMPNLNIVIRLQKSLLFLNRLRQPLHDVVLPARFELALFSVDLVVAHGSRGRLR